MRRLLLGVLHRAGVIDRFRNAWQRDLRGLEATLRAAMKSYHSGAIEALDGERKRALARERELSLSIKHLQAQIAQQQAELGRAVAAHAELHRRLGKQEAIATLSGIEGRWLPHLPRLLSAESIREHISRAVASAPLDLEPFPHLVIEDLFPSDFYAMLVECLPPSVFFSACEERGLHLQSADIDELPGVAREVWRFFEQAVPPAVAEAVGQRLMIQVRQRLERLLGADTARRVLALSPVVSGGRMRRYLPGFRSASVGPKRSTVTVLVCLAPMDDPSDCTVRLHGVNPVNRGCRPNTALALLNEGAAHGAEIPVGRSSALNTYEFHIGPELNPFVALLAKLPGDVQQDWLELVLDEHFVPR